MRTKHLLLFLIAFGMLAVSCKKEKSTQKEDPKETTPTEKTLKDFMADSWETIYLKIDMKTHKNSDSTHVFEDKFGPYAARRARSMYNSDGTFSAWFVDGNDNDLGQTSVGDWDAKGDTLYVSFVYGGRDMTVTYFIEKTEEGFIGTSHYDWDEDGEFDDVLLMKTKRIQLGN